MVMRNLIKRILTETTKSHIDQVLEILLKKYPNPIEDLMGSVEYLKELGFEEDEISKIFKHYFKTEKPLSETYYQVFDEIFQPDAPGSGDDNRPQTTGTSCRRTGGWQFSRRRLHEYLPAG